MCPSDPTGRHPSGVLTRHPADFFDDNCGTGALYLQITTIPTNTWLRISLYNNSNTGVSFKVYAITSFSFGGGGLGYFFISGTIGAFQQACSSINPSLAAPFGQLFGDIITGSAAVLNPFITKPLVGIAGNSGFDSSNNLSPFPVVVLPAGYSLVCCNLTSSSGGGGAGFLYQESIE